MAASIIDGKVIAADLRAQVAGEVTRMKRDHGLTPAFGLQDMHVTTVRVVPAAEARRACPGLYEEHRRTPSDQPQRPFGRALASA